MGDRNHKESGKGYTIPTMQVKLKTKLCSVFYILTIFKQKPQSFVEDNF